MELRVRIGHWDSQVHVGGGLIAAASHHPSRHLGECLWLTRERCIMYLRQGLRSDGSAVNDLPCLTIILYVQIVRVPTCDPDPWLRKPSECRRRAGHVYNFVYMAIATARPFNMYCSCVRAS